MDKRWEAVLIAAACTIVMIIILVYFLDSRFSNPEIWSEGIGRLELQNGSGSMQGNVYLAVTSEEQAYGLMYQKSIGDCNGAGNCMGMLFIFNNVSRECFWMENTIIPLRQYWITNNTITGVVNGTPYSVTPYCHYGNMVLETNINSTIVPGYKVYLEGNSIR